ncbi:hypothetical protein H0N98_04435 [Candidatus Micrarchaeota archaeon]|nr:hypothetical protein [Candidatus Micrarchaeota archaeon]
MRAKAQASTEIMITVAFVVTIMFPLLIIAYMQSANVSDQLAVQQAQQTATKIANYADTVGAMGYPTRMNIQVFMPQNIDSISVGNSTGGLGHELIIKLRTSAGTTQIVGLTLTKIAGDLSTIARPGTYFIKISAEDNCTQILDASMQDCVYIERS